MSIHLLTWHGTVVRVLPSGDLVHEDFADRGPAGTLLDLAPMLRSDFQPGGTSAIEGDALDADHSLLLCGATVIRSLGRRLIHLHRDGRYLRAAHTPAILEWLFDEPGPWEGFLPLSSDETAKLARLQATLWRPAKPMKPLGKVGFRLCPLEDFRVRIAGDETSIVSVLENDDRKRLYFATVETGKHFQPAGLLDDAPHFLLQRLPENRGPAPSTAEVFMSTPDSVLDLSGSATVTIKPPLMLPDGLARFTAGYFHGRVPPFGPEHSRCVMRRETNRLVALDRLGEGVVLGPNGTSNSWGFLGNIRPRPAWMRREQEGVMFWPDIAAQEAQPVGRVAVFYNGNLHNYYHWLIEAMVPLGIMKPHLPPGFSLLMPERLRRPLGMDQPAVMSALGFDALPITWSAASLVAADEVLVVDGAAEIDTVPAAQLRDLAKRLSARVHVGSMAPLRLLISRRNARGFANGEAVEALAREWGFTALALEELAFEDQVQLFRRAEFVMAMHGAGLSNLLFCRPGTRVLEIMPDVETRPFYWLLSEKLGLKHAMLHCPPNPEPGGDPNPFNRAMIVDVERLAALFAMLWQA